MQKPIDVNRFVLLYKNPLTGFWSMNKPVGGRGVKAPYETTHVRVPKPILEEVERLKQRYHDQVAEDDVNLLPSLEDATVLAKAILNQKKSARVSIEKLLTALYKSEVKL